MPCVFFSVFLSFSYLFSLSFFIVFIMFSHLFFSIFSHSIAQERMTRQQTSASQDGVVRQCSRTAATREKAGQSRKGLPSVAEAQRRPATAEEAGTSGGDKAKRPRNTRR